MTAEQFNEMIQKRFANLYPDTHGWLCALADDGAAVLQAWFEAWRAHSIEDVWHVLMAMYRGTLPRPKYREQWAEHVGALLRTRSRAKREPKASTYRGAWKHTTSEDAVMRKALAAAEAARREAAEKHAGAADLETKVRIAGDRAVAAFFREEKQSAAVTTD